MGKEDFPEITEIMSEDSGRESGERIKMGTLQRGKDNDPSLSWPQRTKLTDRSRAAERLPAPLLAGVLLTQLRKPYPPSRTGKTVPIHAHAGGSECSSRKRPHFPPPFPSNLWPWLAVRRLGGIWALLTKPEIACPGHSLYNSASASPRSGLAWDHEVCQPRPFFFFFLAVQALSYEIFGLHWGM